MALSIRINPGVLKWVMDNEGWSAEELAAESGLSASQVRRWASAESDISIRDLKRMSGNFKRPMSVLFMGEVPAVTVPSFRRADGGRGKKGPSRLSRGALDVIREARYVQGNAAEMLRSMGRSEHSDVPRATTRQSPESAAAKSAADLGIRPPRRTGRSEERDRNRYNDIRERIESRNVFTMQAAIPADDHVSGFALGEPAPAVILVNSRDTPRRRIFTLLHEYAHVVLNDAGVACAAVDAHGGAAGGGAAGGSGNNFPNAERWCNRFAGAVLMPRGEFLDALQNARTGAGDGDTFKVVDILSDKFCVSRTAALTRVLEMLDGDDIAAKYSMCYGQMGQGGDRSAAKGDIPLPRAVVCMARRGRRYARLALSARESGVITTSTLLEYLGIKLGHLDDLRARCGVG